MNEEHSVSAARETPEEEWLPEDVRAFAEGRMQEANRRLIAAEIREVGAEMGLIDPEAALVLMDASGVAVNDDGSVSGVKEALETLLARKPYLAGRRRMSTGGRGNFARGADDGGYAARLDAARSEGNHALATAIIGEAAAKGISLR